MCVPTPLCSHQHCTEPGTVTHDCATARLTSFGANKMLKKLSIWDNLKNIEFQICQRKLAYHKSTKSLVCTKVLFGVVLEFSL